MPMQNRLNPITNTTLLELANPSVQESLVGWDDETCAFLAVAIPEMAKEILQFREALCIAIHPEAAQQSLERARAIIRAPDPITPRTLMAACQTLLMHSRDAAEQSAAKQIIKEMEAAA